MDRLAVYLYGFVPDGAVPDLSSIEGVEGAGHVEAVSVGGALAVVGRVSAEAFETAMTSGADGGPDPGWVVPRALRHQAVLDVVLTRSPILPSRFGTLFSSIEALAELAGRHREAIAGFFEALGDRVEWSLRGYFDPAGAVDRLLATDPAWSSRVAKLPEAPGSRYFLEKKLREEARREARKVATRAAEAVRRVLRERAGESVTLPNRPTEGPSREMVLHETFLMSRADAAEAISPVLHAADSPVEGLLVLEPTGPWPPFHFCPDLGGPPA
jgi:hypothetical protein